MIPFPTPRGGVEQPTPSLDEFVSFEDLAAYVDRVRASGGQPTPSLEDGEKAQIIRQIYAEATELTLGGKSWGKSDLAAIFDKYACQFKGKNLSDREVEDSLNNYEHRETMNDRESFFYKQGFRAGVKQIGTVELDALEKKMYGAIMYESEPIAAKKCAAIAEEYASLLNKDK